MKFVYEPQSEGAVIKEKRLIGSPRTVDRWIDSATPTQLHALSKIREWAAQNEDEARITGDEVFLGISFLGIFAAISKNLFQSHDLRCGQETFLG